MSQDGSKTSNATGEGKAIDVGWSDTLDVGEEIHELFRRGGEEEAAHRFARSYPLAGELGVGSVVGRSPEGRLVMHATAVPRTFRGAGAHLTGALLENLVVEESYRDFWSPIRFLNRAVEILRARDEFDFVYTEPGENVFALVRASGFDLLESMRTYVFPLVPGWPTHMLGEFPLTELDAQRVSWRDGIPREEEIASQPDDTFRIVRSPALYEGWVRENLTDEAEWIVLRIPGQAPEGRPAARILVTPLASHRSLGIMDLVWNERKVSLESLFYQVALQARRSGFRKLAVRALGFSALGQAIDRYGFVGRTGERPVLTRTLREGVILPPPSQWLLTWLDIHR